MRRSEELLQDLETIEALIEAVREFQQLQAHSDDTPRKDELTTARHRLDRLSGQAAPLGSHYKMMMRIDPPPMTGQSSFTINPIQAWDLALRPPYHLDLGDVISVSNKIAGRIEAELAEQKRRESRFTWKLARSASWPMRA